MEQTGCKEPLLVRSVLQDAAGDVDSAVEVLIALMGDPQEYKKALQEIGCPPDGDADGGDRKSAGKGKKQRKQKKKKERMGRHVSIPPSAASASSPSIALDRKEFVPLSSDAGAVSLPEA